MKKAPLKTVTNFTFVHQAFPRCFPTALLCYQMMMSYKYLLYTYEEHLTLNFCMLFFFNLITKLHPRLGSFSFLESESRLTKPSPGSKRNLCLAKNRKSKRHNHHSPLQPQQRLRIPSRVRGRRGWFLFSEKEFYLRAALSLGWKTCPNRDGPGRQKFH